MKHRHVRVAIHEVGELQLRLKPKMEVELELGEPLPVVQAQDIAVAPPGAPGMKKGGKVKKMASGGKVRGAGIAKRGIGKCKAC